MTFSEWCERTAKATGGRAQSVLDGYIQAALQGLLANPGTTFNEWQEKDHFVQTIGRAAVLYGVATYEAATEHVKKEVRGVIDVPGSNPVADAPQDSGGEKGGGPVQGVPGVGPA